MSEVEKMYRSAGVKKYRLLDRDNKLKWVYPEFTAEKQLSLIKWLSRKYIEISNYDAENGRMYNIKPTVGDFATSFNYDFSECIAGLISNLWQDLTKQQRTEIRSILNG